MAVLGKGTKKAAPVEGAAHERGGKCPDYSRSIQTVLSPTNEVSD